MKLKSLELCGFKSFPDKTKLDFENGFTAVVGPNGSGKSNISDAIRWVLGEQSTKSLRGQKMEDVIFAGTHSRKPNGFARVSLIFDNSDKLIDIDSDEIVISRKYYRNGDSEYALNGKNVLLKEISEILMDTGLSREGYAIVGQGRIDEIVSAKSSQRRQIFEEAAGITKYKYRKKEAVKKLELAQENLVRLTDILGELENRIGPLKVQCEKAKKFKKFDAKKRELEIFIWLKDLDSIQLKLKKQDDRLNQAKKSYLYEEQFLEQVSNKIKLAYDNVQNFQLEIERLRNKKEEFIRESSLRETKIAVLSGEIDHVGSDICRMKDEAKELTASGDDLAEKINEKKKLIAELQNKLGDIDEKLNLKKDEFVKFDEKCGDLNSSYVKLSSDLNSYILEKSKLSLNISSFNSRASEISDRKAYLNKTVSDKKQKRSEAQNAKDEILKLLSNVDFRCQSLNNSKLGYEMKLNSRKRQFDEVEANFRQIEKEILKKQQKVEILNDLEKNFDGYNYSVKQILKLGKSGGLLGICGTVSQLIDVPCEYTTAIETALGGGMQNVVVENEMVARKAIAFLKSQDLGRATFFPLTSIRGKLIKADNIEHCEGFIGIAANLLHFDNKYENIVKNLLGRTVIVDDLDLGTQIAKKYDYAFKIVTLDGQVINAGGSFTGGSKSKNLRLLSRKSEISSLKSQIDGLNKKFDIVKNRRNELNASIEKISYEIKILESEMKACAEDKIKFSGDLERLKDLIFSLSDDLSELESESFRLEKQIDDLSVSKDDSAKKLDSVNIYIENAKKNINSLQIKQDDFKQKRVEFESQLRELDIRKNEIYININNEKSKINDMNKLNEGNVDKLVELKGKIRAQLELVEKKQCQLQKEKALKEEERFENSSFDKKINELIEKRTETEKISESLRESEKEHQTSKEHFGNEFARLEEQKKSLSLEYDKIIENMWETYEITLSEAQAGFDGGGDYFEAKKKLLYVKSEIKKLGSINLEAISEYEEVYERYNFLNDQVNDAKNSKIELEKLIQSLTFSMRDIFKRSFYQINNNFKQIFKQLFGGGEADLSLDDEADVLESGINIEVQPPGKIIKNLASLSGGEKAFVAIAIYFAIIKFRPSPFCILDEIEAALDDVNVAKFAAYIKNIDDDTQFIVITHRRGTMEEADVLYGVTMQDDGISRLLKLKSTKQAGKIVNG